METLLSMVSEASATLLAAILAAASTLAALAITIVRDRSSERRNAYRTALGPHLSELSDSCYQCVALSVAMAAKKSSESFDREHERAVEATKKLDRASREVRLLLWGLEDAFGQLRRMPSFVQHSRNQPQWRTMFIDRGTALRKCVDRVIANSYHRGRRPTCIDRLCLWWRSAQLERAFRPEHAE